MLVALALFMEIHGWCWGDVAAKAGKGGDLALSC